MYSIAIIDDHYNDLIKIYQIINEHCIKNNYPVTIQLFDDPLKIKHRNKYDIVFLDIDMPHLNGIDYAKTLEKPVFLVFITYLNNLVFDSFAVHPYDFIRKNLLTVQLPLTLDSIFQELDSRKSSIIIKTNRGQKKLKIDHIMYCETIDHITTIHTNDNEQYEIRQSLKETIKQIHSHHFIRINKSHYINMDYIDTFNHKYMTLKNNITIPIGKDKYDIFIKKYLCD